MMHGCTVLDLVGIAAKNEFEDELAEGLEPTHITFRHYYSSNSNIPTPTQPYIALHITHCNILIVQQNYKQFCN